MSLTVRTGNKETEFDVCLKVDEGVSGREVYAAMKGNGFDDIYFECEGKRFVCFGENRNDDEFRSAATAWFLQKKCDVLAVDEESNTFEDGLEDSVMGSAGLGMLACLAYSVTALMNQRGLSSAKYGLGASGAIVAASILYNIYSGYRSSEVKGYAASLAAIGTPFIEARMQQALSPNAFSVLKGIDSSQVGRNASKIATAALHRKP